MIIGLPGTYTVSWTTKGSTGSVSVGSVTLASPSASLQTGHGLTVNGGIVLSAGTFSSPGTLSAATLIQSGGTFYDTGAATFSNGFDLTGGSAQLANGTVAISSGATIAGAGSLSISAGSVSVTGGLALQGGSVIITNTGTQGAGILNADTLSISGGTFSEAATGSTVTSQNQAVVSGGAATISAGNFTVASGGLLLDGGTSAPAGLTQTGGYMSIAGGETLAAASSILNGGTAYITSGGLSLGGASSILVNGGSVVITGNTSLSASSATISSNAFYGYQGGLSLTNGSTFSVSGGAATFDNAATLLASSEILSGSGTFYVDAAGVTMDSGNSLVIRGGAFTAAQATTLSASSALVSAGTFFVMAGGLTVTNTASLGLSGGLMTIKGGATLVSGATASISGGTLYAETAGLTIGTSASMLVSGGYQDVINGTTLNGGTLSLAGGASFTTDALTVTSGRFSDACAIVGVNNTASFATSATISAGSFGAGTVAVTGGTLDVAGGTLTSTSAGVSVAAGSGLILGGASAILDASTGGLALQGTLSGSGTLKGTIAGSGVAIANGGVLDLTSGIAAPGTKFQIAGTASSILRLDGTVAAQTSVQFVGASGALELNDVSPTSIGFAGTVAGLGIAASSTPTLAGQTYVNVQGSVTKAILVGNTAIALYNGSTNLGTIALSSPVQGAFADWASDGSLAGHQIGSGTDVFLSDVVCFAAGTLILTPDGEIPVEQLSIGESVITLAGDRHEPRPVRWIGYRHIDLTKHPMPEQVAPVRVHRHAFGPDQPRRDLLLSPAHAVFVDGQLFPIKRLLNGMTITQDRDAACVSYYHIELDCHAVLLAEGQPAESYLDTGNRGFFANSGSTIDLHPDMTDEPGPARWKTDACAPLVMSRDTVLPLWERLVQRAHTLGFRSEPVTTTTDPDVHLAADGRIIRPISAAEGRSIFLVGRGATQTQLVSRSAIPADEIPASDDLRRLGVAVTRIVLRRGDDRIDVPPDHPTLRRGWHAVERQGSSLWRWTNGKAELPIPGPDRPTIVEIWHRSSLTYRVPVPTAERGRAPERRSMAA